MRIEEIVSAGYGFRLLKIGEETEHSGVEVATNSGWIKPHGNKITATERGAFYRVPIKAGPGWDLVPEGETIKEWDQYLCLAISPGWMTCVSTVGRKAGAHPEQRTANPYAAFRRRKPEPVNTCAAVEEKREWYWFCAGGLMTEKEARAAAIAFTKGDGSQSILLRAVSTFEKKTAVEIVETKLCSPQS
jgi:hypothetical protein